MAGASLSEPNWPAYIVDVRKFRPSVGLYIHNRIITIIVVIDGILSIVNCSFEICFVTFCILQLNKEVVTLRNKFLIVS